LGDWRLSDCQIAAESPNRRTTEPPNRRIAKPPNRRTAEPPNRRIAESPNRQIAESRNRRFAQLTKSPNHQITESPNHQITKAPNHQIAKSPDRQSPNHQSPNTITRSLNHQSLNNGEMADLRLHVHGMDCAEEAALVRRALAPNRAVQGVEFDLIHGNVDIAFDAAATTETALVEAVRGTGLGAHTVHALERVAERPGEATGHLHEHAHADDRSTISTTLSGVLFLAGWIIEGFASDHWFETFVNHTHNARAAIFYGMSAFAGLWPMWPRAAAALRHRRLDMHALVCLTVIGAAAIGEWSEGAAVAFLFALAHRLEAWSIDRARAEIAALVGRGPSLVAHGLQHAAPVERWIERFAAIYTPVVTGAAVLVALVPPLVDGQWSVWFYRALVFLVLACPCALVISTPVTMVAALTSAARRGVLVKGGAVLEKAAGAAAPTRAALAALGITVAGARERSERLEAADVVVTAADDRAMELLVHHARRALRVVRQNVAIALLTKVAFLISAPFGFAPLWMAVLADTGATVIVTLNALRLLSARGDA
jgi:cation transport ATPase